jgi:integrase/recombinase XerD
MSLSWKQAIKDFEVYLRLEKSLSKNSIKAYSADVSKLERFFIDKGVERSPLGVSYHDLKDFLIWFGADNPNARSQSSLAH